MILDSHKINCLVQYCQTVHEVHLPNSSALLALCSIASSLQDSLEHPRAPQAADNMPQTFIALQEMHHRPVKSASLRSGIPQELLEQDRSS